MRLAGVIQRRMIPEKPPVLDRVDIAATYIPCFDVGGDFYDFLQISESSFVVVIADVIGKGIPAAIMMSMFRGAVKAYTDAQDSGRAIADIIAKLNAMAYEECRSGEFITLFYAVIDSKAMTITYCSCGHEPTVLIRDGQMIDLEKGGLVLGVMKEAEYEIETLKLKTEDCMIFYTDGLIDSTNFEGKLWGREKMLKTAKKFTAVPASRMVKNILSHRRRFVGLARQNDDTSIIVVKMNETKKPD